MEGDGEWTAFPISAHGPPAIYICIDCRVKNRTMHDICRTLRGLKPDYDEVTMQSVKYIPQKLSYGQSV